jgi:carbamoyl-phosphate synthase large subunit
LDAELPLIIHNQRVLDKMGIKTFLPTQKQFDARNKDQLPELSTRLGCSHPQTYLAFSIDELIEVLKSKMSFPAVVKGKFYKAYLVYNLDTAILKGSEIASEWGFPLLVQERIDGQEVNLIGLSGENGEILGRVSIKKQLVTQLGKVWTAVSIRDEQLDRLCDRFCKITKWRGPFELECMIHQNKIYLIEINPRFPSWVYFATAIGVNLPKMLLQLIFKEKCRPKLNYPAGKYLVRYSTEFVSSLGHFERLISSGNRKGL